VKLLNVAKKHNTAMYFRNKLYQKNLLSKIKNNVMSRRRNIHREMAYLVGISSLC